VVPRISLIVPSYNRRDPLLRLLVSVAGQDFPSSEFEVLVVLDGSTDGSAGELRSHEFPFALRLIEQPNSGAATARNAGVSAASGEVCVFVDDDVILSPGAISGHWQAHAAATQPSCVVGLLRTTAVHGGFPRAWAVRWSKTMDRLAATGWSADMGLYSGNMSLPRETARTFPFREGMRRLEDTELGRRLRAAGIPFVFAPAASGTQVDTKDTVAALADLRLGGATAVRLAREVPVAGAPVRRRAAAIGVARVASAIPLPDPLAAALGAIPHWMPGAPWLFHGMSRHAYLRGVGSELSGAAQWKAYLRRPRS
jgi:hypothetical protein